MGDDKALRIDSTRRRIGTVLEGDAFNHLRNLDAQSIGMLITDPPSFETAGPTNAASGIEIAAAGLEPFVYQFRRVSRPGAAVVVLIETRALATWTLAAERIGLIWMAELSVLWNDSLPRTRNFGSLTTHVLWWTVPGARHQWNSSRAVYSNIIVCDRVPRHLRYIPTQKPIELTTFLISLLSKRSDIVVDPFCGSGSTLVSAELCGRSWIGIEREAGLCEIARRRVLHSEVEEDGPLYLWQGNKMERM